MNLSKYIIAEINKVVEGLVGDGTVYKKTAEFFRQMMSGMISKGSVMLSDTGRYLNEKVDFIQTEKRLSYQLNTRSWDSSEVVRNHLRNASKYIHEDSVIAIDMGDISKEYARKAARIGMVWDGSRKEARRGWWMVEAVCCVKKHVFLPLMSHTFHTQTHRYRSHNIQINYVIEQLLGCIGPKGIWTFDRGFDDQKLFAMLRDRGIKFVVRLRSNRYFIPLHRLGMKRLKLFQIARIARKNNELVATIPVAIPDTDIVGMLVINYAGKDPYYLFTNISTANLTDGKRIVGYYARRWSVEDSGRVIKTVFKLENIRARTPRSLSRLVHIATWAQMVLFKLALLPKRLLKPILSLVKAFDESAKIVYYRLAQALKSLLIYHYAVY